MRWFLPIVLLACGGSSTSTGTGGTQQSLVVQPTSAQSLSVAPGGMLQLNAYQRDTDPYGAATLVPVTASWSSSNMPVATVDQSGLVTAMASGSSVITASSGGATGKATVTVGP
jgi:trimeric autotransporter adhesin